MKLSPKTLLILAVFAVLFLLTQWLFVPRTYVQSRLLQALQAPKVFLQALVNRHEVVAQLSSLQLENQSLRAQLTQLQAQPGVVKNGSERLIYAQVYSTYPFNNASRLLIHAGSLSGVRQGAVVLAAPGIFLGEVVSVTETTSEVRTIYDPSSQVPVKIGDQKIDSLLVGGHEPTLTLISKKKPTQTGQTVITASKQYPYGLTIGVVDQLKGSDQNLFQEANLKTSYKVSELNEVFIIP